MISLRKAFSEYGCERAAKILAADASIALSAVRAKWATAKGNEFKYLNVDEWMPKYAHMAQALRLDKEKDLKILDIGAGPGLMSWVAKKLGHEPVALDLPQACPVYGDMCSALGVSVIPHRVTRNQFLPPGNGYGVALFLMASFYIYRPEWDAEAFNFLLADLESRMSSRGVILFELNHAHGQFLSMDTFDIFLKRGYRICDNFAFRISGHEKYEEKFIYNSFSRYHRIARNPWQGIWRYESSECLESRPCAYIDALIADFPDDMNLLAQKGLFHALKNDYKRSCSILETVDDPTHVGKAVALAQMYLSMGNIPEAIRAIGKLLSFDPENIIAREWISLLALDRNKPVYEASDCWNSLYHLLDKSIFFANMRNDFPKEARQDPVSWYLRYGIVSLGYKGVFSPAVYWGSNNNVFRSGIDPLIHYMSKEQKGHI